MEENLIERWYALLAQRDQCPGAALKSRLKVFHLARYALHKNFESLQKSIEAMKPESAPDDYTIFEFGDKVTPGIFESCRCLQNFIISAKTLVDQSTALVASLYAKGGKIPEYQAEIERRFKKNGLHHFVQCLRNVIAHDRVPTVAYTEERNFGLGKPTVLYQVHFRKDELIKYERLNALARSFLEQLDNKIDIAAVTAEYHRQVDELSCMVRAKAARSPQRRVRSFRESGSGTSSTSGGYSTEA
jgi:hypothetical protein